MKGHTPGPWEVREPGFYIGVVGDPCSLAEVKSCYTVKADDIETHKANARLIASAPDLYRARAAAASGCPACYGTGVEPLTHLEPGGVLVLDGSRPCSRCRLQREAVARVEGR